MTKDINKDYDWNKLYDWFHGRVEILQDQLDRLSGSIRAIDPNIKALSDAVVSVEQATKTVTDEVNRAQRAWANSEAVVKRIVEHTASTAYASATTAVKDSVGTLDGASKSLASANARLITETEKIGKRFYIQLFVCLILITLATYAGFYFSSQQFENVNQVNQKREHAMLEKLRERETAQLGLMHDGKMLRHMLNNATPAQRRVLEPMLRKAQLAERRSNN